LEGQGAVFLNFDGEADKARFRAAAALAPSDALRSLGNPPVLVIDEAQRLPEASRIIKGRHDARLPAKFLLLGSSSLDLLDQAAESLTGRNRKVSVNELATQLQMARPTVERYLDLLEQTFVIFRLPSFSTNPRKEIAKSQKVFFWDTGIRNALLNALSTDEFRPDIGALWENWVIAEVAKRNALLGSPAEPFFWRTRAQSKVDLVVKQGNGLRAFEIKWSPRRVSGRAFRDAYGVEVEPIRSDNPFAVDIFKT